MQNESSALPDSFLRNASQVVTYIAYIDSLLIGTAFYDIVNLKVQILHLIFDTVNIMIL